MKKTGLLTVFTAVILTFCIPFTTVLAASDSTAKQSDPFQNLQFRNLGPAVAGGRVSVVVGIPGNPHIYYVGAAAGGVWKSTDGGQHWDSVLKDADTASIGAIALAPPTPTWYGSAPAKPMCATTCWTEMGCISLRTPGIAGNSWV
jgi:hypothetical protein